MWKRLQGHVREKEKQIGNPVLLETTYDEDQLRHIPNVSDAQNATYQPNTQSPLTPTYAYNTLSPRNPRDYRASEVPTVSSIYSQPSPDHRNATATHSVPADVSPPSSPEPDDQEGNPSQPRRFRSMRDVSPVDENRGRDKQRAVSNIPVLRKAPRSIHDDTPPSTQKFWGGKVAPNSKVRWDEYSGEPTATGRPGQVSPGSYAKGSVSPPSDRRTMGYQVSVSGPQDKLRKNAASSERGNRAGARPPPVDTGLNIAKQREPWRGASGRTEIVPAFKHQPAKQPPQNFQRKPTPQAAKESATSVAESPAVAVTRDLVPADTAPVADNPNEFDTLEDPIKPTPPLKVGRNSPPRSIASPISLHNPAHQSLASPTSLHSPATQATHSYPSPSTPTNNHSSVTGSHGQGGLKSGPAQEPSTPANTKATRRSIESTPGSLASIKENGPASRFSWTTYNTSTTYQHSPPPSPPPPLPTSTPVLDQEPLPAAASILNRRRPVQPVDKFPARKPVSSTTAQSTTMASSPPSPRPSSTFSTDTRQKALPRPPTEISAADHVDILEAQMEDLRIQRSNVYRLLQDLNNMAPPNPLITNFKRMRLVEKRKKDFEEQLAEIRREEHDVGLRLHRAYRKRENADPGSESAIWVRRVTR